MKFLSIAAILCLLTSNSYAEKCEGFNACADLYTKLTGEKLNIDESISDDMTLAIPDIDLTVANAKVEFLYFLNKNVVTMMPKNRLVANRKGDFLISPIYIVSEGNIPRMINKDGLVTFVYHSKSDTKNLVSNKTRGLLSRKKNKSESMITVFPKTKVIAVSDTDENATRIINLIIKSDK